MRVSTFDNAVEGNISVPGSSTFSRPSPTVVIARHNRSDLIDRTGRALAVSYQLPDSGDRESLDDRGKGLVRDG